MAIAWRTAPQRAIDHSTAPRLHRLVGTRRSLLGYGMSQTSESARTVLSKRCGRHPVRLYALANAMSPAFVAKSPVCSCMQATQNGPCINALLNWLRKPTGHSAAGPKQPSSCLISAMYVYSYQLRGVRLGSSLAGVRVIVGAMCEDGGLLVVMIEGVFRRRLDRTRAV